MVTIRCMAHVHSNVLSSNRFENPLAQQILSGELIPGKTIRLEVNDDRIVAVQ